MLRRSVILIVVLVGGTLAVSAGLLTNDDMIKLTSAKLPDAVLIAKINEAEEVNFALDTDDLIALSEAGVSGDVIAAMLERNTAPKQTSAPPSTASARQDNNGLPEITLVAGDGSVVLNSVKGAARDTVTMKSYMDFSGNDAGIRTTDRRPTIRVRSNVDPSDTFYVVHLKVKDSKRVVKIAKGGMFKQLTGSGMTSANLPKEEVTVPYSAQQIENGLWELTLSRDLVSGEYGVYADLSQGWFMAGSVLYDFGVDS